MMISINWSALELRHLAALTAVADEGSFAGAAERLGYTQAAVSQQVAALEKIVGARLIRRSAGRRPQGVTRSGQVVLSYAKTVLTDMRVVQAKLATMTTARPAEVRIGTCASLGARIMPDATGQFLSLLPDTSVELIDGLSDDELFGLLKDGELDMIFTGLPDETSAFETVELLAERYVLVVPAESPLAMSASVAPRALDGLPLIGFRVNPWGMWLERQLHESGVVPRYRVRTDNHHLVCELVLAGWGCGLLPVLAVPPDSAELAVVDIQGVRPRRLGAIWRAEEALADAPQSYLDIVLKCCAGL